MTEHRGPIVEILLEAPLSSMVGRGSMTFTITDPLSMLEVLHLLADNCASDVRPRILKPDGLPASGLLFFLNNRPVAAGSAGQTKVKAGDVLLLCPPISGG